MNALPPPAAGQRYACEGEEGFTLSRPEPGRGDGRYWVATDGRVVDMYAVSPLTGWRVEAPVPVPVPAG